MRKLRSIRDDNHNPRRRQDLDERIEQAACFRICPMQVFEDKQQGARQALGQEQTLDRRKRAIAPRGGVESFPISIVCRDVEQPTKHGYRILQVRVQAGYGGFEFIAYVLDAVGFVYRKVRFQQIHDREIRCMCRIRSHAAFTPCPS